MTVPKNIVELRALATELLGAPGVHDPNDMAHRLARGVIELLCKPTAAPLAAETITDEQIAALWREACGPGPHTMADADTMHLCTVAVNHHGDFTAKEQDEARARCAEILNARRSA